MAITRVSGGNSSKGLKIGLRGKQGTAVSLRIWDKNDITLRFFAFLHRLWVYKLRTIEYKIFPEALFEKNRFFTYREGGGGGGPPYSDALPCFAYKF